VPIELVSRYGIVKPVEGDPLDAESFRICDIVEKPSANEAPSLMAVSARYIFGPEIFSEIRKLAPAADGELGITDAIRGLIEGGYDVRCVQLNEEEVRYDIGSHESYYKAFIDFALQDPNCGEEIRKYLESLASSSVSQGGKE
jgi:UTP--glucose-1-phosphate uridylyltransferase